MKIDHIELYVKDLQLALAYYTKQFQFSVTAYYQSDNRQSVLINQGDIQLLLTCIADPSHELYHAIQQNQCEVGTIAFSMENIDECYDRSLAEGAESILAPTTFQMTDGEIRMATVSAFRQITYCFIMRSESCSDFLPGYESPEPEIAALSKINKVLNKFDHLAICVPENRLNDWAEYHRKVYLMRQSYEEYVVTEKSGMNSKVMESQDSAIKLVFVAPALGKRRSQIHDYLAFHQGPCVQHIAFTTTNIINSVKTLTDQGINFLAIPDTYYQIQRPLVECDDQLFDEIREHKILIDQLDTGFLYQIFTKPLTSAPTLFFEIIQRTDCHGFASGNIKALFQAIEAEQEMRDAVNA